MSKRVGVSNSLGAVSNLAFDGEDEESGSGKRVDLEVLNLGDFTGEELTDFFFLSFKLDEESDLWMEDPESDLSMDSPDSLP